MSDSKPPVLSLVVPCLNEAESLGPLAEEIRRVLTGDDLPWELVFVDDGSTDDTLAILRRMHAGDARVRFVSFSRNFGQQAALSAGLDAARGRAVVLMDCDLQHPPGLIPEMVKLWTAGYDAVNTIRESTHGHAFKRYGSRAFYALFHTFSDIPIEAGAADFRLLDRKLVDHLRALPERNRFYRGLVPWLGFRQVSLPYRPAARLTGKTKYSPRRMIRLGTDGLLAFSEKPLFILFWAGSLAVSVSALYAGWLLIARFVLGWPVAPWKWLAAAVLVTGSALLCSLGTVSLYIAKVYQEVKGRPSYIVRETDSGSSGKISPPV